MASITIPLRFDPRNSNIADQLTSELEKFNRGVKKSGETLKDMMSGDAQYVVTVDFKPGTGEASIGNVYKKGDEQLNKLVSTQKKATQESNRSLSSLRQQVNTWKQKRDGVAKYVNKIKDGRVVGRELNKVWVRNNKHVQISETRIAKLNGNVMQMAKIRFPWIGNLMNMGNALQQIVGIAQAVGMAIQAVNAAVAPLINRSRQIDGMKLSFEGFGMSAEQAASILDRSKEISLRYGASLSGVEKGFKRITPAILASGGSLEETAMIMESLSARTATLGLNTEQTGRYIEAFAQVMGKGKLQSEELNQQFSELDGSLRSQIANYLESKHGITDLEDAMKKGKVTAGLFREAFVAISKEMRENLAGSIGEIQSRMDELNIQQVENIVNTLNTITIESLADTFSGLGKSLQRIGVAFSQFFASITTDLPALTATFKGVFDALGVGLEVVVNGFLVGVKIVLKVLDEIMMLIGRIAMAIASLPVVKQLINATAKLWGITLDSFREGTDMILNFDNAVNRAGTKLETMNGQMMVLQNKFDEGKISEEEFNNEMQRLQEEVRKTKQEMENLDLKQQFKEGEAAIAMMKDRLKELQLQAAPLKAEYDKQKAASNALKDAVKARYDIEINKSKEVAEQIKGQLDSEKERHKAMKDIIKDRYDEEKRRVDEIYDKKMSAIQAEIDALGGKTPAEEKLAKLRKQELQAKLGSRDLSYKERLEIEAQLERMERQEQIQQKQNQLADEKKNKEKEQKNIQDQRNKALDDENSKHERNKTTLEGQLDSAKQKTDDLKTEQKKYVDMLSDANKEVTTQVDSLGEIPGLVAQQVRATNEAKDAYFRVKREIDNMTLSIKDAQFEQIKLNKLIEEGNKKKDGQGKGDGDSAPKGSQGVGAGGGNKRGSGLDKRFAGGPVTGGTSYTVNELGQEGFLSSTGRLSSIDAPSWGTWRAPGAGTVIPAHVWSEMTASGANAAASGAAAAARGVNPSGGMARVLRGMVSSSNDRITNNVTIQAANTVQAASDMMVQLNRIRRRRMG